MLLHGSMCELAMRHRQVTAIGEICPTLVTSECMQTTKAILFRCVEELQAAAIREIRQWATCMNRTVQLGGRKRAATPAAKALLIRHSKQGVIRANAASSCCPVWALHQH